MAELQDIAKAAFDASAHLIAVPDMDLRRFLMAHAKNCEGLLHQIAFVNANWTANGGLTTRQAKDAALAATLIGIKATSLSDWAKVERQCAIAIAKEIAQSGALALDHGKLANLDVDDHALYLRRDGVRPLTADWDAGGWKITSHQLESDAVAGIPLIIASTLLVANLNVDLLDGIHAAEFIQRNGLVPLTSNWDIGAFLIRGLNFRSDVATGTQPWITGSTTVNTNLNADMVDGHHAAKFRRKTAVGFISNPTAAKSLVMDFVDAAATMVKVYAEVDTGTVDINVEERAFGSADTAGTDTLTAELQADTTGATSVTFDNAGLAADSYLHLTISAKSGSPTKLTVVATYDLD